MRKRTLKPLLRAPVVALLVAALLTWALPRVQAQGAGQLAAATENQLATRAAVAIMQTGGNAVDGAIVAALVGGVTSPTSSGIGGGGFALVWSAKDARAVVLDFREVAPAGVDAAAFERRPLPDNERGKLVGVPGEVAGLFELSKRFGKKPWQELVAPAQQLAEKGFPVHRFLSGSLLSNADKLKIEPGITSVFYPGGKPAATGQLVRNPKLAKTLQAIAQGGPPAFYQGAIAQDLVRGARSAGGALTMADLARYKPVERKPLEVSFAGHTVYTMPPPSAGGLMLVEVAKVLDAEQLRRLGRDSGAYQHLMAEAMRGAIADRMRYVGDPDHEKLDVAALLAPARMEARKKRVSIDRTHAVPRFGLNEHGTHHLCTSDRQGNMVALTTTVNRTFGAKLVAPDSGVVLNDQLDDFTALEDVKPFGMKQSPNRPRPGAKPVSSMTPTIAVRDKRAVLALGGSGGTTIATNTTQLAIARLLFGSTPQQLVASRRFYVPTSRATILLEDGAPAELKKDLEYRGEIVAKMPFKSSAVQIIAVDKGRTQAASDARKHGGALVR